MFIRVFIKVVHFNISKDKIVLLLVIFEYLLKNKLH